MKRNDGIKAVPDPADGRLFSNVQNIRPTQEGPRGISRSKGRKRLSLGERDWEILGWAHDQKFLTSDQVARWFPEEAANIRGPSEAPSIVGVTGRSRSNLYIYQRLRKLVRYDVLRRVAIHTESADAILPGRLGLELLVGKERSHGLTRLEEIDWKNFFHDRAVTDLRWILEKRLGGTEWKSERELRRMLDERHTPDALVDLSGHGTVAIELELTRKSLSRYVDIFERYVKWETPRLGRVLYVLRDKADLTYLFAAILPAVVAKVELWGVRSPDLSRFRFTTLSALLARKAWWTVSTPDAPTMGEL